MYLATMHECSWFQFRFVCKEPQEEEEGVFELWGFSYNRVLRNALEHVTADHHYGVVAVCNPVVRDGYCGLSSPCKKFKYEGGSRSPEQKCFLYVFYVCQN
jgi:hypothetical protein